MNLLLDTNVVSERRRKNPDAAVLGWLERQPIERLHLSAISVAEIEYGLERMPAGARRDGLVRWRDDLVLGFGERLLPMDAEIAMACGRIRVKAERSGLFIPLIDAFLAATAEVHGLTVVTRNLRDFGAWGGPLLNPWTQPTP